METMMVIAFIVGFVAGALLTFLYTIALALAGANGRDDESEYEYMNEEEQV